MKIENVPGEFASKALIRWKKDADSWGLTAGYFFSKAEVDVYYNPAEWDVKWPLEMHDECVLYVPAPEELQ